MRLPAPGELSRPSRVFASPETEALGENRPLTDGVVGTRLNLLG